MLIRIENVCSLVNGSNITVFNERFVTAEVGGENRAPIV